MAEFVRCKCGTTGSNVWHRTDKTNTYRQFNLIRNRTVWNISIILAVLYLSTVCLSMTSRQRNARLVHVPHAVLLLIKTRTVFQWRGNGLLYKEPLFSGNQVKQARRWDHTSSIMSGGFLSSMQSCTRVRLNSFFSNFRTFPAHVIDHFLEVLDWMCHIRLYRVKVFQRILTCTHCKAP